MPSPPCALPPLKKRQKSPCARCGHVLNTCKKTESSITVCRGHAEGVAEAGQGVVKRKQGSCTRCRRAAARGHGCGAAPAVAAVALNAPTQPPGCAGAAGSPAGAWAAGTAYHSSPLKNCGVFVWGGAFVCVVCCGWRLGRRTTAHQGNVCVDVWGLQFKRRGAWPAAHVHN